MRLLLWFIGITAVGFAGLCLLASGIGRSFPNTVIAYTETCDDSAGNFLNKLYIADWRPGFGLRFALPEQTVPFVPPSWSPDGQQIAYSVDHGSRYDVYIRDFKTGTVRQLPADTQMLNMSPSWSPDGHSVAFFAGSQVGVYDTLTDQVHQFPIHIANSVYPNAWSPDGRSLAVFGFYPDQRGEIYVLNIESGDIQDLSRGQFDMTDYPAWSPDGRYVTFSGSKGTDSALYRADVQTNILFRFSKDDAATVYIASAWSPDGRTIAVSTATGTAEVHLFNPSGDLIRKIILSQQIPAVGGGDNQVVWSPDGGYLVVHVPNTYQWVNYAYELATGTVHLLSPKTNCYYSSAVWRPNFP